MESTATNVNIEFKQLEHQIEGDTGQVHCRTTDSEEIAHADVCNIILYFRRTLYVGSLLLSYIHHVTSSPLLVF